MLTGPAGGKKRLPRFALVIALGLATIVIGVSLGVLASALNQRDQTENNPPLMNRNVIVEGRPGPQTPNFLSPIPGHMTTPTLIATPNPTLGPTPAKFLLGTNLALFDTHDQVLNSAGARSLLRSLNLPIIRMPTRSNLPDSTHIQMAQIIKDLGATPLVILQGRDITPDALAYDLRIIGYMNNIFGSDLVYYEYGNEEDLLGIKVGPYTSSWNVLVPELKKAAKNGRFIGPVNYQYDPAFLRTFLQNASPRPDVISWHEYTCDYRWDNNICISHIDNWSRHIADARSVIQSSVGSLLPIMITEWNYAPNAIANDGKNNNNEFMQSWTTKALQTLAANHLLAAIQYSCTNTAIPLITSSDTLTTQGTIMQDLSKGL